MALQTPNLTTDITGFPEFPITESEREYGVSHLRFRDGSRQTFTYRTAKMRKWTLRFLFTDAEFDNFMTYYDARSGHEDQHYWDNPQTGENDIPVAFVQNSLQTEMPNQNVRRVTVQIEEVKV